MEHGGDQVAVLIEDQQRLVNVLVVVGAEIAKLLLAVQRVVGRIEIEDEPRRTLLVPLQIRLEEFLGQQIAALGTHLVFES